MFGGEGELVVGIQDLVKLVGVGGGIAELNDAAALNVDYPVTLDVAPGVEAGFCLEVEAERAVGNFDEQGDVFGAGMAVEGLGRVAADNYEVG